MRQLEAASIEKGAEIGNKLRAEIVVVKAENAELRGQFRMLKELLLRDEKHTLMFPGEAANARRSLS